MQARQAFMTALLTAGAILIAASAIAAPEGEPRSATPVYIKLEVEDFGGFDKKTWDARMAWWPQWSRGGDSGWWGAKGAAEASSGEVSQQFTVPAAGAYTLWVRYEDYRGQPEPFDVIVEHVGGTARHSFGQQDLVARAHPDFPWSYAWAKAAMPLKKGPARVAVALAGAAPVRRGLDALVLTNDPDWTPKDRGFPPLAYTRYLDAWAKERQALKPLVGGGDKVRRPPAAWALPVTVGRDFWYFGAREMLPGYPRPVSLVKARDGTREAFVKGHGAKPEAAPVFGSPLCAVQLAIGQVAALLKLDNAIGKYILATRCPFVLVGNYGSAKKVPDSYGALKQKFGDLWVGIISGEGSYMGLPTKPKETPLGPDFKATNDAWLFTEGRNYWRQRLERDWASKIADPFEKVILCSSVGTLPKIHRMAEAGSAVIGSESAAAMPYTQVQIAFARGAARQYGKPFTWYYGASFGDAIRTFAKGHKYVLKLEGLSVDNRNAVIGPSLAHIRRVLLHAYLQGASFFHPEQGGDLFGPDGKLNPMGWCYDEMLRLAQRHPDRGIPYTPIAVLLDRAHGWDKYTYRGSRIWDKQPLEPADRMINGFFNVAQYPFPRNEGDPVDDLNVPWPNGYFGDVFDVLVAGQSAYDAVKAYPVVFCVGDTRLDAKWAATLKSYVAGGGALVINAEQVVAGMDEEFLGAKLGTTAKEASTVVCERDGEKLPGTLFSYREVAATTAKVIARTPGGAPTTLVNRVGRGQVILTTPSYLLGQDTEPLPYLAHLLLELTSGLLPVQVRGNCQYYVNLHPKGYVVVLSHNEGIRKSTHSPAKLDPAHTATVNLTMSRQPVATEDWLGEQPQSWAFPNEWLPEYTQPVSLSWRREGEAYQASLTLRPGEIRVFHIRTK